MSLKLLISMTKSFCRMCTRLPGTSLNAGRSRHEVRGLIVFEADNVFSTRPRRIWFLTRRQEVLHDGMVFCLGRRSARAHAAEMVIGWALGAGLPSGRHRALRVERCAGASVAVRLGK